MEEKVREITVALHFVSLSPIPFTFLFFLPPPPPPSSCCCKYVVVVSVSSSPAIECHIPLPSIFLPFCPAPRLIFYGRGTLVTSRIHGKGGGDEAGKGRDCLSWDSSLLIKSGGPSTTYFIGGRDYTVCTTVAQWAGGGELDEKHTNVHIPRPTDQRSTTPSLSSHCPCYAHSIQQSLSPSSFLFPPTETRFDLWSCFICQGRKGIRKAMEAAAEEEEERKGSENHGLGYSFRLEKKGLFLSPLCLGSFLCRTERGT